MKPETNSEETAGAVAPATTCSPLSDAEIAFMRKLESGFWMLKDDKATPRIQSLIDRGYCRTAKVRSGPLGIYTGEVSIHLTEAGKTILANARGLATDSAEKKA